MSNSDKDFITRIQVSQLVTDDPYADDFYFHIMTAIKMSRHNAAIAAGAPGIPMGPGGPAGFGRPMPGPNGPQGPGGNNNNRKPTRQQNAMNRMAQNVQRLVDNAKQRNNKSQCKYLPSVVVRQILTNPPLLRLSGSRHARGNLRQNFFPHSQRSSSAPPSETWCQNCTIHLGGYGSFGWSHLTVGRHSQQCNWPECCGSTPVPPGSLCHPRAGLRCRP